MSYIEILLLAFALSIDACVVSFSYGLCEEKRKSQNALLLAVTTGMFQGIMPLFGGILANIIKSYIIHPADWISFIIFMYLGISLIREAYSDKKIEKICLSPITLVGIGIATSIDAFSAGIPLVLADSPMIISAILIGVITFINSIAGYSTGIILKRLNSKIIEITGGLALIFLAVKSLL